jgi:hypothetical protein
MSDANKQLDMGDSQKKGGEAAINGFKLLLLALMVAQNSATVLVGRYTRSNSPKDELFIVNHLVMVTEVAKVRTFQLIVGCFSLHLLIVRHCYSNS